MTALTRSRRDWKLYVVPGRTGKLRYVVECPYDLPELTWDNDFGRGMRCYCRTFPTRGKAERYIEKHKELEATHEHEQHRTDPAYSGG